MKRALEAIQKYRNKYIIINFTVKLSVTTTMRESYSHPYVCDYNIFFCCCPSELLNNVV